MPGLVVNSGTAAQATGAPCAPIREFSGRDRSAEGTVRPRWCGPRAVRPAKHTGRMIRSETRLLTTHTGSLPRPPSLAALHGRRSRGEAVDADELRAAVESATAEVVASAVAAGIDIGNDGEQARESFFTYVQHRMNGFGGAGRRPLMADLVGHPDFMELALPARRERMKVNLMTAAGGDRRRQLSRHGRGRRRVRTGRWGAVRPDVHDRGISRDRRVGDGEPALRLPRGVRPCGRRRPLHRVPRHRRPRPAAPDRRPGPGIGAPHPVRRPAARRVPGVGRAGHRRHQPSARRHRAGATSGSTCAGATTRVRTPATSRSTTSGPCSTRPRVGGVVIPSGELPSRPRGALLRAATRSRTRWCSWPG